ncbi:hypothetical protein CTAYLR_004441 [Chrysophaeum taylorii]|uniref:Rab-GAP TBC domain-containing protein n=1 Tax=Chrysophaeum taylorii TaxID=2483200 RepID=A0AAD7XHQ7_9STRA|nr:hypothetical protein CTAYLR_004441 [Chrysophaeum taylorii]
MCAGADDRKEEKNNVYHLSIVVKEARFSWLPYGLGVAVVRLRSKREGEAWVSEEKCGRSWRVTQTPEVEESATCNDRVSFGEHGEVLRFDLGRLDRYDQLWVAVELWSSRDDASDARVPVGVAHTELKVFVPGLLMDEWRPLDGDIALGDIRFAVALARGEGNYDMPWAESFDRAGPSVELSSEACAERRRRRDWAQRVTWERSKANVGKGKGQKTVFVLRRRIRRGAATLLEAWGFDVDIRHDNRQVTFSAETAEEFRVVVAGETRGWSSSRPALAPGDEIVAATSSAELHHLKLLRDSLVYHAEAGCDLSDVARQSTLRALESAATTPREHAWLVVRRSVDREIMGMLLKREPSHSHRRPSFLARDHGHQERNALRDLAWRGFSRANRQEVYRGVAFAMEFLSTKRQSRRRSLSEPNLGSPHPRPTRIISSASDPSAFRSSRERLSPALSLPLDDGDGHRGLISNTVRKCVAAFAHHPRPQSGKDWSFEDDATAREQLEAALASQHGDAHLGSDLRNLREVWQHERQLSFEDALDAAKKEDRRKKKLFDRVAATSRKLIVRTIGASSSHHQASGSLQDEDTTPRWIIDSLIVATQAALDRAPLPAEDLKPNRYKVDGTHTTTHDAASQSENDDEEEHVSRTFRSTFDVRPKDKASDAQRPHSVVEVHAEDQSTASDTGRHHHLHLTSLIKAAGRGTRHLFSGFSRRRKPGDHRRRRRLGDTPATVSKVPRSAASPSANKRIAASADRVARAYLARNTNLHELDGGIHEPTARALAATLIDKVGVDERTSFYVLAFFFEELAAEATIHDRTDSRDVASLCAALFSEQLPGLTRALLAADFPPNPAMLECWLTLFPVALPETTLLRWLDVLLFEGWEGLVNIALAWYREHEAELNAVAAILNRNNAVAAANNAAAVAEQQQQQQPQNGKSHVADSTMLTTPAAPSSTSVIVCAMRDILHNSADADYLLNIVKQHPNETLHRHALSLDEEGRNMDRNNQDSTASLLFDNVMVDVVRNLEDHASEDEGELSSDDEDERPGGPTEQELRGDQQQPPPPVLMQPSPSAPTLTSTTHGAAAGTFAVRSLRTVPMVTFNDSAPQRGFDASDSSSAVRRDGLEGSDLSSRFGDYSSFENRHSDRYGMNSFDVSASQPSEYSVMTAPTPSTVAEHTQLPAVAHLRHFHRRTVQRAPRPPRKRMLATHRLHTHAQTQLKSDDRPTGDDQANTVTGASSSNFAQVSSVRAVGDGVADPSENYLDDGSNWLGGWLPTTTSQTSEAPTMISKISEMDLS